MTDTDDCSEPQQEQQAKSKNQLKNEAKKAAKLDKFAAKQAKLKDNPGFKAGSKTTLAEAEAEAEAGEREEKDLPKDETPSGQKKDMSRPMLPAYEPRLVEAAWYSWWEASGFFRPEHGTTGDEQLAAKPKFTMILPPPNVTGSLHVGHAMMGSIEDALARWHRMRGDAVLFLPGCDHAGIATQAVVEKKLKRDKNLTKHDLGREAFVAEVWRWKEQYGQRIYEQLKRMGLSLDWTRARFTLDASVNEAVNEAFCRLFEEGLIFRADRLVNWSGKLKTALSDLEVEMREIAPREMLPANGHDPTKKYPFGLLWSFAYAVEGSADDEIVIQTTRPETLFADVAVAVNPKDGRYTRFHGKRVIHPLTGQSIPVIVDEVADPEFGTGALKISPAHDPIDFAVGERLGLPSIVILDEDNRLLPVCGPDFAGLPRYEARLKAIEAAKAKGMFRGEKDHPMVLPICTRSGDFVEPRVMPQWWLNCQSMADRSMAAVTDGLLAIVPEEQVKVWNNWLGNIRDWCLSRQLWWGHQIPAYRILLADGLVLKDSSSRDVWVVGRTEEEAMARARVICPALHSISRDHDVLDTWFSSGLWPFSTMGWPHESKDMAMFYPNTLLETGSDILFFWVARMVMLGVHLTGKVPFSSVFLHSIVRDAHGRKMSKSLGNVIDPVDVIEGISLRALQDKLEGSNLDPAEVKRAREAQLADFPEGIPECGTDALRFALCAYVAHGRDVNLNVREVHAYRRFCNKLWQAVRFALGTLGPDFTPSAIDLSCASLFDKWILSRLTECIGNTNAAFDSYVLMNATKALYSFWLNDLCDVYIEAIKPTTNATSASYSEGKAAAARNVLFRCIHDGLLLLHPIMPYVTEELYQRLPKRKSDVTPAACVAKYPCADPAWAAAYTISEEGQVAKVLESVREIRSVAADSGVSRGSVISLSTQDKVLIEYEASMASLVKAVGSLRIDAAAPSSGGDGPEPILKQDINHCTVSFYPKSK